MGEKITKAIRENSKKELSFYFSSQKIANGVENGVYQFTKQFCDCKFDSEMEKGIYEEKLNDIIFNLQNNSDTIVDVCHQIENGDINPFNLAFLSPSQLDITNWKKIIDKQKTSDDKINNQATIEWKKCKNCKSNQYFHKALQTRSADEPVTNFYTCKICATVYRHCN
jgi:DNA-directed RNA polymerase subunit M/transcription elongation factor TFIIS